MVEAQANLPQMQKEGASLLAVSKSVIQILKTFAFAGFLLKKLQL